MIIKKILLFTFVLAALATNMSLAQDKKTLDPVTNAKIQKLKQDEAKAIQKAQKDADKKAE